MPASGATARRSSVVEPTGEPLRRVRRYSTPQGETPYCSCTTSRQRSPALCCSPPCLASSRYDLRLPRRPRTHYACRKNKPRFRQIPIIRDYAKQASDLPSGRKRGLFFLHATQLAAPVVLRSSILVVRLLAASNRFPCSQPQGNRRLECQEGPNWRRSLAGSPAIRVISP